MKLRFLAALFVFTLATVRADELKTADSFRDAAAKAKVDAIKELAEQMAKDANGMGAKGALENFRVVPMDAQKFPKEAQEIADVLLRQAAARELELDEIQWFEC